MHLIGQFFYFGGDKMKAKRKLPDKEKIDKRQKLIKDWEKLIAIEP